MALREYLAMRALTKHVSIDSSSQSGAGHGAAASPDDCVKHSDAGQRSRLMPRFGTDSQCSTSTPVSDGRHHSSALVPQMGISFCPDSFDMCSKLGEGSFGAVYKVIHRETGNVYALKVLKKEKVFSQGIVRYALTERNVQANIQHPFIVSLFGAFQTSRELAMVMQYCPGGSLEHLVRKTGGLPEPSSQLYFAQIFLAIEHLHDNAIVYRDLKCENVVIDEDNNCMLADFGLAKEGVTALNPTASFVGSISHVTPDVLARQGYGPAVDIYGLGTTLFEMLTGRPPFYAQSRAKIFKNVQSAELVVPDYVTQHPASLIRALMCRQASERLGASSTRDLRSHPFLAELDLGKVLARELSAKTAAASSVSGSVCLQAGSTCKSPFEGRFQAAIRRRRVEGWDYPEPSGVDVQQPGFRTPTSSRSTRRGACLFGFRR